MEQSSNYFINTIYIENIIKEIITYYDSLKKVSVESFNCLKSNKIEDFKISQNKERKLFKQLKVIKKDLFNYIQPYTLQNEDDFKALLNKTNNEKDKTIIIYYVNELFKKEKEMNEQIQLNIEMISMIKKENI